ncbi:MAG TPA: DUF3822 family protein [Chitinophagales bacterium]|nr:DUF3822 family protein [Chitinophagales bacterium]
MNTILPRIHLADEQLQRLNKSNCGLAVYLSPARVAWSILDLIHHRVVSVSDFSNEKHASFGSWEEGIRILDENDFGLHTFGSVKIALGYGKSLLVPGDIFEEGELKTYLEFGISSSGEPVKDFIATLPAYNVYSIPAGLLEGVRKLFETFMTVHVSTPFIETIIRENKHQRENRMFANLAEDNLHLAAIEQGKFVFYNCYSIKSKEDFSYYMMAAAEELSFHPEQIIVSLSGDITPDSENYQTAKRFLKNLTFADCPKALKYSAKLDTVPKHLFALLYSIHLCE